MGHVAWGYLRDATEFTYGSLDGSGITEADLKRVAGTGEPSRGGDFTVIPVRMGTRVVGSLALEGARVSPATEDSIASLFAINYERVRALDRAAVRRIRDSGRDDLS